MFLVRAVARRLGQALNCVLLRREITVLFPSWQAVGWDNMAFVFLNRYLDLSEVSHLLNSLKKWSCFDGKGKCFTDACYFRHIFEVDFLVCVFRVSRKVVWTCWITVILPTLIFHLRFLFLKNNIYRWVGKSAKKKKFDWCLRQQLKISYNSRHYREYSRTRF